VAAGERATVGRSNYTPVEKPSVGGSEAGGGGARYTPLPSMPSLGGGE